MQTYLRSELGKARPYSSVSSMAKAQEAYLTGAEQIMPLVARTIENFAMQTIDAVDQNLTELGQELYQQNPWATDGPSDPPLHSAEAWKITMREGKKGQIIISVTNPKDYMQFLEEGWSPQAPPGWIAAIFREFWLKLGKSVRRIR